ncbi:hypothetical protein [Bacillus sp. JCM 19041]|uniref:hypothetical protein n=1 Tax=Bacillus sp. JCM 19041 TaxID=1460637 RepID=UPI000A989890
MFQTLLVERYKDVVKGDETISGFGGNEQPPKHHSILLYSSLGATVVLLTFAFCNC